MSNNIKSKILKPPDDLCEAKLIFIEVVGISAQDSLKSTEVSYGK